MRDHHQGRSDEGTSDGAEDSDGVEDASLEGLPLGDSLGPPLGTALGDSPGTRLGAALGTNEGASVGSLDT